MSKPFQPLARLPSPIAPLVFSKAPPPVWRAPLAKRPLSVDTVCSLGAELPPEQLESFFRALPGFVAFKRAKKGGFAKFESCERAEEAVSVLQAEGIPGAMAHSSMAA